MPDVVTKKPGNVLVSEHYFATYELIPGERSGGLFFPAYTPSREEYTIWDSALAGKPCPEEDCTVWTEYSEAACISVMEALEAARGKETL